MKRLVYVCDELDTVERVSSKLQAHSFLRCRWSVMTRFWGAVRRRDLPTTPIWQRKDLVSATLKGAFWGGMLGVLSAVMLVSMTALPVGELRSAALWSFPICLSVFGGWIGGFLGLAWDHPRLIPYLHQLDAGNFLILVDVKPEDERLMKKVMSMSGASKLAEQPLGLTWNGVFPTVVSGRE